MTSWPSGLRRCVKAAVFWAWVRIPPKSHFVCYCRAFLDFCNNDLDPAFRQGSWYCIVLFPTYVVPNMVEGNIGAKPPTSPCSAPYPEAYGRTPSKSKRWHNT